MDIHRADPAYRNRTLLLLALTTLLCVVFLLLLDAWLKRIGTQLLVSDPGTARHWLRGLLAGLGIALALPASMVGAGLRRLGSRSRDEGRFPPSDWKTLRDVRVLRDTEAVRWSMRTERLGMAFLALAAMLAGWALWAWWRFA